jgi:hypothetical protein|uniref:Uncharacterized protein n=1 Tax=Siphoviridae sp. ctD6g5 TaxID=2826196 RepID=A0A8S5MRM4_9CAUD|nr:MAG TPA: hypothetical protein [Siphoviridae sp. ctD6g5]
MERLTKTYSDGTHGVADNLPCGENSYEYKGLLLETLGKYEDSEEQGLLLRLPCKVGDILYFAHHDRVIFSEVLSVKYHVEAENHGIFIRERLTIDVEGISAEIDFCDIGKNVFLTRAEAEAKLKSDLN